LTLPFSTVAAQSNLSEIAYRDFWPVQPKGYVGPLFKLNHHYPTEEPPRCTPILCPWLFIPVKFNFDDKTLSKEWLEYVQSVFSLIKESFYVSYNQLDAQSDWYSMPWLTTNSKNAQEFIHGAKYSFNFTLDTMANHRLSHELSTKKTNKSSYEVWSAAYYNRYAGYSLGQMWNKNGHLKLAYMSKKIRVSGLPFKPGSVKIKFNFISTDHLYDHHNGPEPLVLLNRHAEFYGKDNQVHYDSDHRAILPATLAEIQVAVLDPRSPTSWVYLAFEFNPNYKAPNTGNLIENFDLIGIQFGNDPQSFPAVSKKTSQPIHQSFITPYSKSIKEGCSGRLITFLGKQNQSCASCHQTAYLQQNGTAPFSDKGYPGSCTKEPGDLTLAYYFQNLRYPESYNQPNSPSNLINLDNSLRLKDAVAAYLLYNKTDKMKAR
jgi:hypothetical protein